MESELKSNTGLKGGLSLPDVCAMSDENCPWISCISLKYWIEMIRKNLEKNFVRIFLYMCICISYFPISDVLFNILRSINLRVAVNNSQASLICLSLVIRTACSALKPYFVYTILFLDLLLFNSVELFEIMTRTI